MDLENHLKSRRYNPLLYNFRSLNIFFQYNRKGLVEVPVDSSLLDNC